MADTLEPSAFVEVLAPAVRQAAAIARALEGRVANQPKLGEATAVKAALTIADSAAQEAVLVSLLEAFPSVSVEAEEDTPSVALFPTVSRGGAHVVIDPIDGTLRSYLDHEGPYACMVGLAIDGVYRAALVALPREGFFVDAVQGTGARRTRPRGEARPIRAAADGPVVLVSHDFPEAGRRVLERAGFRPAPACGGAISVAPLIPGVCGGIRLASNGNVSVRGRVGLLVAREAGAAVFDPSRDAFPDDLETPREGLVVVADVAHAEPFGDALAAASAASRNAGPARSSHGVG